MEMTSILITFMKAVICYFIIRCLVLVRRCWKFFQFNVRIIFAHWGNLVD